MGLSELRRASALAGLIAIAVAMALMLVQGTARADIGFESASRASATPGQRVEVTIGCGFCFPACVGRPGHRHPTGRVDGVCMLGGRAGPPRGFGIWLMPAGQSLGRKRAGSSRPPHLPSFTYLGRATRAPGPDRGEARGVPRYALGFRVPAVPSGSYRYVLYCADCVRGPRGTLTESGPAPPIRLRITPSSASSFAPAPWLFGGIAAAIVLSAAAVLLVRSRLMAIPHP